MLKNLFKCFGFAVLMVLFPIISSVIIQIKHITNDTMAYSIQAIFFAIACIIGFIFYKKYKGKSEKVYLTVKKEMLWFFPIIISELLVFLTGVQFTQSLLHYFVLFLFTVFVGISEELFFRGIILEILCQKSQKYAIIVSAIIFSFLHLTNLAGGIALNYAILQVIFAFIFAIVAAQITISSKSILPAIVWHFTHDFIAFVTGDQMNLTAIIILIIQCAILILYSIYLDRKIVQHTSFS